MKLHLTLRDLAGVVATVALVMATSHMVNAANVTIVVNGQQVQFDQPPIEQAGRVFVPLRGVFERLGASVVYSNGVINATGNGRTVQLHIGSRDALVNGASQQLDVAPFLVGPRTMVPLRFVSQALGATVDYDNSSSTVRISMGGGGGNTQAPTARVTLNNQRPEPDSVTSARSPAVSASFSSPVDPNSVHITLDGRDVSSTTDISSRDFLFTPTYNLTAASHTVRVTGKDENGAAFDQSWSFTSGGAASTGNFINNLRPVDGSTVGGNFTVSGRTLPNSVVHIVVVPTSLLGGIFRVSSGTYTADVTADANGRFSQGVSVQALSGGSVTVRITSVAPNTRESKTIDLNLKS
ncbi:MAG: hypothetical protein DLM53_12545 [Candidatus Eremiobacter antarcticus]|nr:hypothetical protein [Candidatus Eremiobacteraeota bacterium]MBC5808836.1 hypothetical protein [Candidatus Eremiobacteraeota bacterium]PZR60476.1 MAG: hypothetical protein DLM53_12545 [Candidatus Eremiobacter sp. RRmetagenome_bin22]